MARKAVPLSPRQRSFLVGYASTTATSRTDRRAPGSRPALFGVLGVQPGARPRLHQRRRPSRARRDVAVISHALWQRRLAAADRSGIVGIELGGEPFTVIGVMPPGFAFPRGAGASVGTAQVPTAHRIWTPLSSRRRSRRDRKPEYGGDRPTETSVRVGSSQRRALGVDSQTFLKENAPKLDLDYRLLDLQEQAGQHVRRALFLLMGAVVFLLVIACANVTNLCRADRDASPRVRRPGRPRCGDERGSRGNS